MHVARATRTNLDIVLVDNFMENVSDLTIMQHLKNKNSNKSEQTSIPLRK